MPDPDPARRQTDRAGPRRAAENPSAAYRSPDDDLSGHAQRVLVIGARTGGRLVTARIKPLMSMTARAVLVRGNAADGIRCADRDAVRMPHCAAPDHDCIQGLESLPESHRSRKAVASETPPLLHCSHSLARAAGNLKSEPSRA